MRRRKPLGSSRELTPWEHFILIISSFTWTGVVLLLLIVVWGFQDVQARWELLERRDKGSAIKLSTAVHPPYLYIDPPLAQVLPETRLEGTPDQSATSVPLIQHTSTPQPSPTPSRTPSPTASPQPTPLIFSVASTATSTPQFPPPPTAREGAPDRLVIPSLGIDTPVVPVTWTVVREGSQTYSVWQVADYAAGWHVTSALPGQPGNTVISGHHNIKGEVFRYLADIEQGAEIDLYAGNTVYRYYVEQKMIVKEKGEPLEVRQQNARWIGPTDDVRLTLITCWPYTNNTHRVIVVAKPRP